MGLWVGFGCCFEPACLFWICEGVVGVYIAEYDM